jgi:hypothetical protein
MNGPGFTTTLLPPGKMGKWCQFLLSHWEDELTPFSSSDQVVGLLLVEYGLNWSALPRVVSCPKIGDGW